ncbi:MAG: hypothetical protein BWY85_01416 [Firmicutes bacterium ADurb.Bin506]|nr:MAG: hypothetical protein BWY85_01416 [Firmicutes bacterium ADurb.Bin506]
MGILQDATEHEAEMNRRWAETNRQADELKANALYVYGSKRRPFWAGCGGTVREYGGQFEGYRKGDSEYMEYIVTRGPMPPNLVTGWELEIVAIEEQQ